MPQIHPTALIHASAKIHENITVGAYTTVEADVKIGPGCRIGSYVTLGERLVLGSDVKVYNYACLGTDSQDKKFIGQTSSAEIGDRTVVREFVTVNRGTAEGSTTRVGADVLLMAYSHVAHECEIGDGVVLVNGVTLGGEVIVEPYATVSGLVGVHQFCRIGRHSIVGSNSKISQDIPPFVIADGHPARLFGPNVVGLRRHGFSDEAILEVRRIYRELFCPARSFIENMTFVSHAFEGSASALAIVDFCRASQRGIARPRPRAQLRSSERQPQLVVSESSLEGPFDL